MRVHEAAGVSKVSADGQVLCYTALLSKHCTPPCLFIAETFQGWTSWAHCQTG